MEETVMEGLDWGATSGPAYPPVSTIPLVVATNRVPCKAEGRSLDDAGVTLSLECAYCRPWNGPAFFLRGSWVCGFKSDWLRALLVNNFHF